MNKLIISAFVAMLLSACTFDPVNYEKVRDQEHKDHIAQNGI